MKNPTFAMMDFFSYPGEDSNDPLSINAMFEHFDQEDVSNELEEFLQCTVPDKLGGDFGLRTPPPATDHIAPAVTTNHNIAVGTIGQGGCEGLKNNIKVNNNFSKPTIINNTTNNNDNCSNNENERTHAIHDSNVKSNNGFGGLFTSANMSLPVMNNNLGHPGVYNISGIPVHGATTGNGNFLRGVDLAGLLQLTEENKSNIWLADVADQAVPRTTPVPTPTAPSAATGVAISDLAVDSRIRNRNSGGLATNANGTIHINGSNPRVFVDHLKETENANPNLLGNQRPRAGLPVGRQLKRDHQPVKHCTAVLLGTVGQLSKNGLTSGAQHHSLSSSLHTGIINQNNNACQPSSQLQNDATITASSLSPIFFLQSCPQQTQPQPQQHRVLQESGPRKQPGLLSNILPQTQNLLSNTLDANDYICKSSKIPKTLHHIRSNSLHPTVDTSALADTLTCEDFVREGQIGDKSYPKPVYSYSCLIAMALKNSKAGSLPVNEIYNFMIENFPYFKNAPGGWKNSVRHNLSLNKCFEKVENPKLSGTSRKGCLWALNPAKIPKMEEEIAKWEKKDPQGIRNSMAKPERLELIVRGRAASPTLPHELANIIVTSNSQTNHHPPHPPPHPGPPPPPPPPQQHHHHHHHLPPTPAPPPNHHHHHHHQGTLTTTTTMASQLDLKSSLISSLQGHQHLEMMDCTPQQIPPSKIEELLGVSLKDVNTLDTSFTLDPALSELALKGSLWDENLNVELSVDIPLSAVSTNASLQTINTLATSGSHINLYSPLTGLHSDPLTTTGTATTGFGHTAYG